MRFLQRYIDRKVVIIVLAIVALFLACSCASTRYIPVETIKTDSVAYRQNDEEYRREIVRDSIFIRDSIYIREAQDTVYVTRWRTEYRDALRTDTLLMEKVDSVFIERVDSIQKVIEVPAKLTRMQEVKIGIGTTVMWAIPIIVALFLLYRKFIK